MKLIINEVECYDGNSWIIEIPNVEYKRGVQHQILLVEDGERLALGFMNGVADKGRYERTVSECEADKQFVVLFKQIVEIKKELSSDSCKTIEESNKRDAYNAPIRIRVIDEIKKLYILENLGLSEKDFIKAINY